MTKFASPGEKATVVFDCNGYSVTGVGNGTAFNLTGGSSIVRNCVISNFSLGADMGVLTILNKTLITDSEVGVTQNTSGASVYNSTFHNLVIGIQSSGLAQGWLRGSYIGANETCVKYTNFPSGGVFIGGNEFNCQGGMNITNADVRVFDNVFNTSNVSILTPIQPPSTLRITRHK